MLQCIYCGFEFEEDAGCIIDDEFICFDCCEDLEEEEEDE